MKLYKTGVVYEEQTIGRSVIPVATGTLQYDVPIFSLKIRIFAVAFLGAAWFLGCPAWLIFVVGVPAIWFLSRKRPEMWMPPQDWFDADGNMLTNPAGLTNNGVIPKNVFMVRR